jgi:hypothetical protein
LAGLSRTRMDPSRSSVWSRRRSVPSRHSAVSTPDS